MQLRQPRNRSSGGIFPTPGCSLRRSLLDPRRSLLMLVSLLSFGCGAPGASVPERVVLVTIDTLRADHVGCYGAPGAHTPTLDTLAAQGVRFETAISPAPLTLPSHTSLMTGLDPPQHGVRHNSIHRLDGAIPTLAEHMRGRGLATAAFVGALVLDRRFGLGRGFDVYDDHMDRRSSQLSGYAERPADRVVDAALEWLESAPARFFLWVHFYDPHVEHQPPPGFAAAFANRPYLGEIAFADQQAGRLLDAIRERFGDAGLLVAVTSDHGESLGEHGERTHSYTIYDATQHVPLIFSGTGVPAGRVVSAPVRLVDVAPTLLAAVGGAPLSDATGRDLHPLFSGAGSDAASPPAYVETLATNLDYGWSPLVGLRTSQFKYIRAPRPELYDLRDDPDETHNLASDEPAVVRRLDDELEARLVEETGRSATVVLDAVDRARLESLGYVVPEAPAESVRLDRAGGPDPKDELPLLSRVAAARKQAVDGDFEGALATLSDIEDPSAHLLVIRASMAFNAGEYAKAVRDARRAIETEPRRLDVHLILGRALEALGDLQGAREAFDRVVELDPRSLDGWRGVARIADRLPDAARAREARERVLVLSGESGIEESGDTWPEH